MYKVMTPEQFTEMYEASYADVLRFVRRRAHPLVVDDIVGEAFLIAWQRRGVLPAEPRAWLFRTAMNVMMNAHRREQRQIDVAARVGQSLQLSSADTDDRLDFEAAWSALSRIDQETLALRAWDDLTAAEAAQVLGITRAGYAMRLRRARHRLTALMNDSATADAANEGN